MPAPTLKDLLVRIRAIEAMAAKLVADGKASAKAKAPAKAPAKAKAAAKPAAKPKAPAKAAALAIKAPARPRSRPPRLRRSPRPQAKMAKLVAVK